MNEHPTSTDAKPPLGRAVEVLVYAPIGLAAFARDTVPGFLDMFIARGRTELEQRHRQVGEQVTQAKAVGQFAVGYGAPLVRRRVEQTFSGLGAARGTTSAPQRGNGGPATTREPAGPSSAHQPSPAGRIVRASAPPASSLAIPDYDELSASQVVERLAGLSEPDLEAVRSYETAHRGRSTILGKITQLSR